MEYLDSKASKEDKRGHPFLSRQTFEYMLHKWPDWAQSVKAARELPEIRDYPLSESYEDRQKWIHEHGGRLWVFAVNVMHHLDLPEHLWQYWLCCVYSDYEAIKGSIDYSKIVDFWAKQRQKIYSPPPYKVGIEGDTSRPGKFGPVRVEIHPSFSYRALHEQAALHARKVAEAFSPHGLHPVFDYEKWAKGQSRRSKRKADARMRVFSGKCDIIDILREEAESPRVRDELQRIKFEYKTAYERNRQIRNLRRKVRARVRDWFSDLRSLPRIGRNWWPYGDKEIKM